MLKTSRLRGFRSRAFTLIEILMVVVILGIASAIMIPQLTTRDDLRCAAAARTVVADLTFAQNSAIAKQKNYYVRFVAPQYSICDSSALVAVDHPMHQALFNGKYVVQFGTGGTPGLDSASLSTVSFAGKNIIGFNDLGEPFAFDGITETPLTSTGTIIVQSGAISLTIQIEPFTGEASVQ